MTVNPQATATLTQYTAASVSLGNSTATIFTASSSANVQTVVSGVINCTAGNSGGAGSSITTLYAGPSIGSVVQTILGQAAAATGDPGSLATTSTTSYVYERRTTAAGGTAYTHLFSFILMPGHALILENLDPGTGTAGNYSYSLQKMEIDYNT